MERPRDDFIDLWVDENRRLALEAERSDDGTVELSMWDLRSGRRLLEPRAATWEPRRGTAADPNAHRRLDAWWIELGDAGLGTTYRLMFSRENPDPSSHDGLRWIPVEPDTPREAIRIHPEQGASYYEAVLGPYDDFVEEMDEAEGGWTRPYAPFRAATDAEVRRHRARRGK